MKNFKKAIAAVAALSVMACMAAVPASAEGESLVITVDTQTVAVSDVPEDRTFYLPVTFNTDRPALTAIEFGVSANLEDTEVEGAKQAESLDVYASLAEVIASGVDKMDTTGMMQAMTPATTPDGTGAWLTWSAVTADTMSSKWAYAKVVIPEGYEAGDFYPVTYVTGGGEWPGVEIYTLLTENEDGSQVLTDYVENGVVSHVNGGIQIVEDPTEAPTEEETEAPTEEETEAPQEETEAPQEETEAPQEETEAPAAATEAPAAATEAPAAATEAPVAPTQAPTAAPSSSKASSTSASPKTGSNGVLPIAGAAAAVALLGGVAAVAKKKD